jgi:predicted O-methyltransferase YrrM
MNDMSPEFILGLAHKFTESRILLTGAELDLFTLLTPAPLPAEEVAAKAGADLRAITILLDALTALGFLAKQEGKYLCPPWVSSFLSAKAPNSIMPMILHMTHLWERWSGLTGVVRGAKPQKRPPSSSQDENEIRAFIGAMHAIAAPLAPRIVAAVNPGQSRHLLDVGGASGTYTLAFLRALPEMRATLFDRPAVIEMARERMSEAGVLDRTRLVSGDFYVDEFPTGHDLAFVSAIIHQNSPEQNLDLFRKVWRALVPGGRIVIRDHVMSSDRTRPKDGAVFAVNMLVGTSGGNTYSYDEIQDGLTHAGFTRVRLLQSGEHMDGLVEGFKP